MTNLATRLITLIFLLQNRPNQKASELAEKLGVSVRTLHRYFSMLDEMGIPVYAERGPCGGFSLVRGYKLPPLIFSPEEAVAVTLGTSLAGELWGELYRDAAQSVLAKLENVLPNEQRAEIAWAQRSLVANRLFRAAPGTVSPLLKELRRAAREGHRIAIRYQGAADREAARREVDPYSLVFQAGWWYLVGYCHLRRAPRTFRVDRIQELDVLSETFRVPKDFDIHAYLQNEFKDQSAVRGRLRFSAEGAQAVLSNQAMWQSLEKNPDGTIDVTISAPDLTWLASMVLGFATLVTVLEPPELREMVRTWAQAIADQYQVEEPGP